jgi:hypothetical protein
VHATTVLKSFSLSIHRGTVVQLGRPDPRRTTAWTRPDGRVNASWLPSHIQCRGSRRALPPLILATASEIHPLHCLALARAQHRPTTGLLLRLQISDRGHVRLLHAENNGNDENIPAVDHQVTLKRTRTKSMVAVLCCTGLRGGSV